MVALVQWNVDHKVSFQAGWPIQNYYYVTFSFSLSKQVKGKEEHKIVHIQNNKYIMEQVTSNFRAKNKNTCSLYD